MKASHNPEWPQCREDMQIINHHQKAISEKALLTMLRRGKRVTIYGKIEGEAVKFRAFAADDVPKMDVWDEEVNGAYKEALKDLQTGDNLIIMATPKTKNFGIYKLPPKPLN